MGCSRVVGGARGLDMVRGYVLEPAMKRKDQDMYHLSSPYSKLNCSFSVRIIGIETIDGWLQARKSLKDAIEGGLSRS